MRTRHDWIGKGAWPAGPSDGWPEPVLGREAMDQRDGSPVPWCVTPMMCLLGRAWEMPLRMQRHREAFRGVKDGEEQDRMGRSKRSRKQRKREEAWYRKMRGNLDALPVSDCLRCFPKKPVSALACPNLGWQTMSRRLVKAPSVWPTCELERLWLRLTFQCWDESWSDSRGCLKKSGLGDLGKIS